MIIKIKDLKEFLFLYDNQDTIINESNISPIRFKESDLSDIIDFVEELLYNNKNIDITEKIAGQHLTVNIKNNFVTVNTKDSIIHNTGDKNAKHTKYGKELTDGIIKYLQNNKLSDQTWSFEIIHPDKNHDYIKYKNSDIIFVEYTGNLTSTVADEIRKFINVRLLTKNEIKVNINKNTAFNNFKQEWENSLKRKYTSLNSNNKSKYYYTQINELKYKICKLLDDILISVVDNVSPVEGIVISTKNPIKLQTNNFLAIQKIQMPIYSILKLPRNEQEIVYDNSRETLQNIKNKYGLQMLSIHSSMLHKSVYDILKNYLTYNSKLNIDTNKYKQWLTPAESQKYLNNLNNTNIKTIFTDIYHKTK